MVPMVPGPPDGIPCARLLLRGDHGSDHVVCLDDPEVFAPAFASRLEGV
jgi:hypothetical protein